MASTLHRYGTCLEHGPATVELSLPTYAIQMASLGQVHFILGLQLTRHGFH